MRLYPKIGKPIKIYLLIVLSSILMISIFGFRDINKEGVVFKFKARIIEKLTDQRGLVVEKTPITELREKRIFVLVTDKTIIGFKKRRVGLDDLQVGMSIVVVGTKVLEKVDNRKIMIVKAKKIQPIVE
ncbi:MAG: hypothetical protein JRI46_10915 [Deltaproteobacteria bacterium]|nr:hypothetical protein [Deltaproteobacteria bacterium]